MSFANKDSFMSSFSVCIPFISFSCFVTFSGTSSMMLKRGGERGHLYLVPNLGRASSFSLLSMMLTVDCFVDVYHLEKVSLYS